MPCAQLLQGVLVTKTLNHDESWALVKSTERLKTGAEMSQRRATRPARRVLRPTEFFAPPDTPGSSDEQALVR
jgi:hypothetical protein